MDSEIASIWIDIAGEGIKKLTIGGIYRQHRLLNQSEEGSESETEQASRLVKICRTWNDISSWLCYIPVQCIGRFLMTSQKSILETYF